MANPNRTVAAIRNRKWSKIDQIHTNKEGRIAALEAAKKQYPEARCRLIRYRIGPRTERLYSYYIAVYATA